MRCKEHLTDLLFIANIKDELDNVANILNWMDEVKDKATIELDDSNFEHDTQASSGSTTGDWFIIL